MSKFKQYAAVETAKPAAKSPSHHAYQIRDREGGSGFWTRIGAVWPHADGAGFIFNSTPFPWMAGLRYGL